MISHSYKKPIKVALMLQVAAVLTVANFTIDGAFGLFALLCLIFWGTVAVIIIKRPKSPTKTDLSFIEGGIIPIMLTMMLFIVLGLSLLKVV